MLLINIILVLTPITLFVWIRYGRLYHKHNAITSRFPNFKEMNNVIMAENIRPHIKTRIVQFRLLYIAYLVMVVLSLLLYIILSFIL